MARQEQKATQKRRPVVIDLSELSSPRLAQFLSKFRDTLSNSGQHAFGNSHERWSEDAPVTPSKLNKSMALIREAHHVPLLFAVPNERVATAREVYRCSLEFNHRHSMNLDSDEKKLKHIRSVFQSFLHVLNPSTAACFYWDKRVNRPRLLTDRNVALREVLDTIRWPNSVVSRAFLSPNRFEREVNPDIVDMNERFLWNAVAPASLSAEIVPSDGDASESELDSGPYMRMRLRIPCGRITVSVFAFFKDDVDLLAVEACCRYFIGFMSASSMDFRGMKPSLRILTGPVVGHLCDALRCDPKSENRRQHLQLAYRNILSGTKDNFEVYVHWISKNDHGERCLTCQEGDYEGQSSSTPIFSVSASAPICIAARAAAYKTGIHIPSMTAKWESINLRLNQAVGRDWHAMGEIASPIRTPEAGARFPAEETGVVCIESKTANSLDESALVAVELVSTLFGAMEGLFQTARRQSSDEVQKLLSLDSAAKLKEYAKEPVKSQRLIDGFGEAAVVRDLAAFMSWADQSVGCEDKEQLLRQMCIRLLQRVDADLCYVLRHDLDTDHFRTEAMAITPECSKRVKEVLYNHDDEKGPSRARIDIMEDALRYRLLPRRGMRTSQIFSASESIAGWPASDREDEKHQLLQPCFEAFAGFPFGNEFASIPHGVLWFRWVKLPKRAFVKPRRKRGGKDRDPERMWKTVQAAINDGMVDDQLRDRVEDHLRVFVNRECRWLIEVVAAYYALLKFEDSAA